MERRGRQFVCHRCGTCCRWPGHVLLTDEDLSRLAEYLGLPEREFIAAYTVLARNRRQLSLKEAEDGSCIFLKERDCTVYPARPQQCREFPEGWYVPGCPAIRKECSLA